VAQPSQWRLRAARRSGLTSPTGHCPPRRKATRTQDPEPGTPDTPQEQSAAGNPRPDQARNPESRPAASSNNDRWIEAKRFYFNEARRFMPDLRMSDLEQKTAAGVRAQAWGSDGALLDDFAVDRIGPVTLVRNAPSPAATSALAIANYLIDENRVLA
jgi:hypothetical protein